MSIYTVSKCHLHSWKIILSCYVAMILQIKKLLVCQFDVLELMISKIKENYLK